jgi:hypothetical protein
VAADALQTSGVVIFHRDDYLCNNIDTNGKISLPFAVSMFSERQLRATIGEGTLRMTF